MNVWDFVNSINFSKEDLMKDNGDKDYIPFIVNRGMSYFSDTILAANMINKYPDVPKKYQYKFYMETVPRRKRFSKWHKAVELDATDNVIQLFDVSRNRAQEMLKLLTPEQIAELNEMVKTGGH